MSAVRSQLVLTSTSTYSCSIVYTLIVSHHRTPLFLSNIYSLVYGVGWERSLDIVLCHVIPPPGGCPWSLMNQGTSLYNTFVPYSSFFPLSHPPLPLLSLPSSFHYSKLLIPLHGWHYNHRSNKTQSTRVFPADIQALDSTLHIR